LLLGQLRGYPRFCSCGNVGLSSMSKRKHIVHTNRSGGKPAGEAGEAIADAVENQERAAISYSVDKTLGVILEVWSGDIVAADLRLHWNAVLTDPDALALRTTLSDLRSANIRFDGNELSSVISNVVIPLLNGRDWRSAVVVDRPVQFGVSRQYQVFAEQFSTDSIFYDYDEALRWLLQKGG
jgi:hypothetical protein